MPLKPERRPIAKLAIAGEGPLRGALPNVGSRLRVLDHTRFHRAVPNKRLREHSAAPDICVGIIVTPFSGDACTFGLFSCKLLTAVSSL